MLNDSFKKMAAVGLKLLGLFLTLVALAIILISLSGCSASQHLRIAKRKDPTLFTTQTDTVTTTTIIEVETVKELVHYDTIRELVSVDPITNTETVIKYKIMKDSIFIDCPDATIVTEYITQIETIEIKPSFRDQIKYALWLLAGLVVLMAIYKVIRIFI